MRIYITIFIVLLTFSSTFAQSYLPNTVLVRFKHFHLEDAELNNLLSDENAHIERRILPLKASVTYNPRAYFKSANNSKYNKIIKAEEPLLRTYVISYEGKTDAQKFCYYLNKKYDEIEIAEPYYLQKMQGYTPNDQAIINQQTLLTQIKAYEAWEIEKGDSNIVIGISDNAIQQTHPDLKDNIAINTGESINGIDDDNNGYIDDYAGYNIDGGNTDQFYWNTFASSKNNHGTMSAGIAGADFDNEIGVAGIGGMSKIFPIRIGTVDLSDIFTAYGYESIIYAAVRNLKVLNCSWGLIQKYSALEQSIVNYALAKDVVIVSAAGNKDGGKQVDRFYPAGYQGVLGVGVVNNIDGQAPVSILGSGCRIMSPSSGNYTTDIDRGQTVPYLYTSTYTSFASPVVAGAVAIARARYPQLNAEQTIEFVRQATDDISNNFTAYKELIPGRLNMLKMVTTDPMSIPGIVVDSVKFYDYTGAEAGRFFLGDTVYLELVLRNVLGNANGLNYHLSQAYPEFGVVDILDADFNGVTLNSNASMTLGKFKYVITDDYNDNVYFRLDITGANGYHDFILFDYKSISSVATFENDRIKFSIGDKGTFGYADGRAGLYSEGYGFIDKSFGDAIYESGIFVTENDFNLVTSFDFLEHYSEFSSLKPFYNPKTTASIMTNSNSDDTFAKIDQTIELPKHSPWVRIKLDLTDSLAVGSRYSIGYKFDWDVGVEFQYNFNLTKLLPSARPDNIPEEKFAAIYTKNKNFSQVFGTAIYSKEADAIAQAGGYNSNDGISSDLLINSLKKGKTTTSDEISDYYNIIGMRYKDNFPDYGTKTCYLCVAAATDTTELSHFLKECASGITSVKAPNDNSIAYNSNDGTFFIINENYIQSEIYDLNGSKVFSTTENRFDLKQLNQGIYFVRIEFSDRYIVKKVSILR